jgi:nucleoside-diphosphate-sugar epimerase
MKVLVLGATGYIGQRLMKRLAASGWTDATGAARHVAHLTGQAKETRWLALDSRDPAALRAALQGQDAVVNCVAGDADSIAQGARALTEAALACSLPPRWVHLSTMSVYGAATGRVNETTPLDDRLGWYGRAKCAAEDEVQAYVSLGATRPGARDKGASAVMLRPGCVYGPGSELWVGRVGRWLQAHRLGDLGTAGDGFSNLVHVDDVCSAVLAALRLPIAGGATSAPAFNLTAPDSPRWNRYFIDLALAIDATPVRRLKLQPRLDAWLAGPPLKLAQIAWGKVLGKRAFMLAHLPDPLPPGLLRLWQQQLWLDGSAAERELGLKYTPYPVGLAESAQWFCQGHAGSAAQPRRQAT